MLNYKCIKYGKKVIKIGRFEPSTQICSCCGHRQKLSLDERTYYCPECGMSIDRDTNAALNIRNFALRDILKNTDGRSGINAFGDESSGKHDASCACETIVDELGKFSRIKLENGNHL
jgi:transposase